VQNAHTQKVMRMTKHGYKIFRLTNDKYTVASLYDPNYKYNIKSTHADPFKGLQGGFYYFTSLTALCKSFNKILKAYNITESEVVVMHIAIPPRTRTARHARGMARTECFKVIERQ